MMCAVLLAAPALLAGCNGLPAGKAEIPASGVTGNNGGATETIRYDAMGNPHFQG